MSTSYSRSSGPSPADSSATASPIPEGHPEIPAALQRSTSAPLVCLVDFRSTPPPGPNGSDASASPLSPPEVEGKTPTVESPTFPLPQQRTSVLCTPTPQAPVSGGAMRRKKKPPPLTIGSTLHSTPNARASASSPSLGASTPNQPRPIAACRVTLTEDTLLVGGSVVNCSGCVSNPNPLLMNASIASCSDGMMRSLPPSTTFPDRTPPLRSSNRVEPVSPLVYSSDELKATGFSPTVPGQSNFAVLSPAALDSVQGISTVGGSVSPEKVLQGPPLMAPSPPRGDFMLPSSMVPLSATVGGTSSLGTPTAQLTSVAPIPTGTRAPCSTTSRGSAAEFDWRGVGGCSDYERSPRSQMLATSPARHPLAGVEGARGQLHYGDLIMKERIGSGASGCVYRARHSVTGKNFAIKQVDLTLIYQHCDTPYERLPEKVKQQHLIVYRELLVLHCHYRSPYLLKTYDAFYHGLDGTVVGRSSSAGSPCGGQSSNYGGAGGGGGGGFLNSNNSSFSANQGPTLSIVMEYMDFGNLEDLGRHFWRQQQGGRNSPAPSPSYSESSPLGTTTSDSSPSYPRQQSSSSSGSPKYLSQTTTLGSSGQTESNNIELCPSIASSSNHENPATVPVSVCDTAPSSTVKSQPSPPACTGTGSAPLHKRIPIPERAVCIIGEQVLLALKEMHEKNHIHRDIKPQNILVNRSGGVRLSDFGLAEFKATDLCGPKDNEDGARFDDDAEEEIRCSGTNRYMSPERQRGEQHGAAADVWALGVTLAECALGRYPFPIQDCQGPFEVMAVMLRGLQFAAEDRELLTPRFIDFIQQATHPDPNQRPLTSTLLLHDVFAQWPGTYDLAIELNEALPTALSNVSFSSAASTLHSPVADPSVGLTPPGPVRTPVGPTPPNLLPLMGHGEEQQKEQARFRRGSHHHSSSKLRR